MRTIWGWPALLLAAALATALGCNITDYPVITDARGADGGSVMRSFYDKAYVVPSGQLRTIWDDGTDELYSQVTQDWKGDQWLYTFNNFDPTGEVVFLDQTYCDPVRQPVCPMAVSWNPDLPTDDVFDYVYYTDCSGARDISLLVSYTARLGECGSGLWSDRPAAALEFSRLERASFRGREWYHLPVDAGVASFTLRADADGTTGVMPVYGRFNGYLDERLRLALPVTPNAKHQLRWLQAWTAAHGDRVRLEATYGSLTASFHLRIVNLDRTAARL